MKKPTDKQIMQDWEEFAHNIRTSTPIDINETPVQKEARIARLEANPEEWFAWHMPHFYTSAPALFHIAATKRILANPEWFEVRSWSRELAKTSRTMMEVLYLTLTGKKHNVLLVSDSYDNAERLLKPYKVILENNNRIINDYGIQRSLGNWEDGEFTTRKRVAFRAVGAGMSPRGTKNDNFRPDVILIDDIDTDADVKNKETIKGRIQWIFEALIPTRSVSVPLLVLACGNIIAKYCCITEMAKKADKHEVINLEDKYGNPTWAKNSPENIARIKAMTPYNSYQKEYCNNPIVEGTTFKKVYYGKVPKLSSCQMVITYADPSTSNKDKPGKGLASHKCLAVIGFKDHKYYIYRVWLAQVSNSTFVSWIFEADKYLKAQAVDPRRIMIENNSLQDPFYQQVILPLIYTTAGDDPIPPILPDSRQKPEKYERISGTLEPEDRQGNIIFDERLKGNPHMEVMEDQWLGVAPDCKTMDGPDTIEGGVWQIKNRHTRQKMTYRVGRRQSMKY